MNQKKKDCTGLKFGCLTVLSKGGLIKKGSKSFYQWDLRCDCGRKVSLERCVFDRSDGKGQKSCGCSKKGKSGQKIKDIKGLQFGDLTAVCLTGGRDTCGKPNWLLICSCGGSRELSSTKINYMIKSRIKINCGNREAHPDRWLHYPETPSAYPVDAGKLIEKYLYLTHWHKDTTNQEIEDEKIDRLIRACWIVYYRRLHGEEISELKEKRLIKKHLRYACVTVKRKKRFDYHGGYLYNGSTRQKTKIGIEMTNTTSLDYPVLVKPETQGNSFNCGVNSIPTSKPKRYKFKRT